MEGARRRGPAQQVEGATQGDGGSNPPACAKVNWNHATDQMGIVLHVCVSEKQYQPTATEDSQSSASLVFGRRDNTVLAPREIIVDGRFDCSVTSGTARSRSCSGASASSVTPLGAITARLKHAFTCQRSSRLRCTVSRPSSHHK